MSDTPTPSDRIRTLLHEADYVTLRECRGDILLLLIHVDAAQREIDRLNAELEASQRQGAEALALKVQVDHDVP